MPRFVLQSISPIPTQPCIACNEAQFGDVHITLLDTSTGDSRAYCWQHFHETLGEEEKELFEALLEYLSERQRREVSH